MGHPGEEVALGLGGPAGLRRRFPEIFLVFQLPGFLLVDVAGRDQKLGHVPLPVPVLGDEGHQIPRAVVPEEFPGDRIPAPQTAGRSGKVQKRLGFRPLLRDKDTANDKLLKLRQWAGGPLILLGAAIARDQGLGPRRQVHHGEFLIHRPQGADDLVPLPRGPEEAFQLLLPLLPLPDKAAHIGDDALEEALSPTDTFMVVSDTQRSPSRLRSR